MPGSKPLIDIPADRRILGPHPFHCVGEKYIAAVAEAADAVPLLIPSLGDANLDEVLASVDGILLTGSPSNVEPHHYEDEGGEGPFDPGRDAIALSLVNRMIDAGRPVFGICRGFQEINVALGGTLRRDTSASDELLRHHAPDGVSFDAMFDHLHPVTLSEGGMLARALGKQELTVNSVHFQGVGQLAPGLEVEARAPDGLVEGFSARPNGAPVIAVQWHPEWDAARNADSAAFFRLLGHAMRGEA